LPPVGSLFKIFNLYISYVEEGMYSTNYLFTSPLCSERGEEPPTRLGRGWRGREEFATTDFGIFVVGTKLFFLSTIIQMERKKLSHNSFFFWQRRLQGPPEAATSERDQKITKKCLIIPIPFTVL